MRYSLKELKGRSIMTSDGSEAKIKDMLFDEESWTVRYVEVDFGNIFSSDRVLIPRMHLRDMSTGNNVFNINLSKDEISRFPKPESNKPISRKYEDELNRHLGVDNYWTSETAYARTDAGFTGSSRNIRITTEGESDSGLHNFNDITDYSIRALDGDLGHIEDMIIDDDWRISYIVIDTANWLPWGKKVLLSVDQISDFSYENKEATVNQYIDTIKSAPEYNSSQPLSEQYERSLSDYYSRTFVK